MLSHGAVELFRATSRFVSESREAGHLHLRLFSSGTRGSDEHEVCDSAAQWPHIICHRSSEKTP